MNSGIYAIRNIINDKIYVGSAKNFKKRKQIHFQYLRRGEHWNIRLQRSFNKYGEDKFVFEILAEAPYEKQIIVDLENEYISKLDSKIKGYNIADATFGDQLSHHPNKEQIIAKMIKTSKARIALLSEEERKKKYGKNGEKNGMYGRTHDKETMKRVIEGTRKTIDEKYGGVHPLTGGTLSEEHKQKLKDFIKNNSARNGANNGFYGKTHSDEYKKIASDRMKGKIPANTKIVVIDGIEYVGLNKASIATGINAMTIRWRALSKNKKYLNIFFKDSPKNSPKNS